ncbi:hypothetical protein J6590_009278 [Homalodisca vitripennis]|nr:hypothetical protein J6590_009278 [Homalodisca vitripennis]
MGIPFALPSDIELRVFNFIFEMQELSFGLTVLQITKLAYNLSDKIGRSHFLTLRKRRPVNGGGQNLKNAINCVFGHPKTYQGVYKSLKSVWAKLLNNHMLLNPKNLSSRSHFHELLTPAFLESFTPLNIIHSIKKAGACPYNPNVLPAEALAPSRLTHRYGRSSPATRVRKSGLPCDLGQTLSTLSPKDPSEEQLHGVEDLLEVPHAPKQTTSEVGDVATKGAINRKNPPPKKREVSKPT